jgi:hypothetical protein
MKNPALTVAARGLSRDEIRLPAFARRAKLNNRVEFDSHFGRNPNKMWPQAKAL